MVQQQQQEKEEDDDKSEESEGECLSRLLPRFKLPVAPDASRWLLLIHTHAIVGSRWLPMASNDSHRVSLLPNHYP